MSRNSLQAPLLVAASAFFVACSAPEKPTGNTAGAEVPSSTAPLAELRYTYDDPQQVVDPEHVRNGQLVFAKGQLYGGTVNLPMRLLGTHGKVDRLEVEVQSDRIDTNLRAVFALIDRTGQDSAVCTLILRPVSEKDGVLRASGEWNVAIRSDHHFKFYFTDPTGLSRSVASTDLRFFGRSSEHEAMFITSFESRSPFMSGGSVTAERAHTGTHAQALSGGDEYGPSITRTIAEVAAHLKAVRCGVWLWSSARDPGLLITLAIDRPDSAQLTWRGKEVWAKEFTPGEWNHFTAEFQLWDLPVKPTDKVSVLLWNKHHNSMLLDDMEVVFENASSNDPSDPALDVDSIRGDMNADRHGLNEVNVTAREMRMDGPLIATLTASPLACVPADDARGTLSIITADSLVLLSRVDSSLIYGSTTNLRAHLDGERLIAAGGHQHDLVLVASDGGLWTCRTTGLKPDNSLDQPPVFSGPFRIGLTPNVAPLVLTLGTSNDGRVEQLVLDTLTGRYARIASGAVRSSGTLDADRYMIERTYPVRKASGAQIRVPLRDGTGEMHGELTADGAMLNPDVAWPHFGSPRRTMERCASHWVVRSRFDVENQMLRFGPALGRPETFGGRSGTFARHGVLRRGANLALEHAWYDPAGIACSSGEDVLLFARPEHTSPVRCFLLH